MNLENKDQVVEWIIQIQAKENQKLSDGRREKGFQKSDNLLKKIDTTKELTKIAGVSHDTILIN